MDTLNRKEFLKRLAMVTAGGMFVSFPNHQESFKVTHNKIGTNFFVDSLNGDDSNSGTLEDRAWKSLYKVNKHVFKPGDHLFFRAGTSYEGQLKPQGSGKKGAPVILDAYGNGAKPVINGWGVNPETILLYNLEYWTVRNIEITNHGSSREARRTGVRVHINNFGTAHDIQLKNLYIHDVNGSLVKSEGGGSAIVCQNRGRQMKSRFDGLLIEDCHLERCERNGINFSGNNRRDEWFPNLNVVIRHNLLEKIPGDGIVPIACDGALVEYNLMRDCPRILPASEAAAGIWPWSCDNTIVQFNEVSDHKAPTDAQGFDSDWNCRNTLIQYNYSHDNDGGFLLVCGPGNVDMPMNIGTNGTVARYNISVNDGLRLYSVRTQGRTGFSPTFHISGKLHDTKIYNNVIYVPKKPSPLIDTNIVKMNNWGGTWPEDTLFANNIFYVEDEASFDWGESKTYTFENNVFYGRFTNMPPDKFIIRDNPEFVAPELAKPGRDNLGGFKLKPNSPCINTGRVMAENVRDFYGNKITDGKPDRGAFEFEKDN